MLETKIQLISNIPKKIKYLFYKSFFKHIILICLKTKDSNGGSIGIKL
jgi:hypothetical protein